MMTLLPLYLQDAFGQSPATAGIAMIPFALPLLILPTVGGRLAAHLSSRAILALGLGLSALGNALTAAAVLAGWGYVGSATGMFAIGCGAGFLNSETAKALISAVPVERAGMASGIASTTRFIGISFGLAGLGAVLATVTESSLRRQGEAALPGHGVDWRSLSLRIVGGDAERALAELPTSVRAIVTEAVQASVAHGFGAVLSAAMAVAVLSSLASWWLVRSTNA